MPYEIYKVLHITGLVLIFLGLGGILLQPREGGHTPKLASILHGAGLLVMLVPGFGMMAKHELGMPKWLLAKIGIWLVLGGLPALYKRKILPAGLAWLVAAALGAGAAYLALMKPF